MGGIGNRLGLWGDAGDLRTDLPEGGAGAETLPEAFDIAGVGKGVVARDEGEERGFARAILAGDEPTFALVNLPI